MPRTSCAPRSRSAARRARSLERACNRLRGRLGPPRRVEQPLLVQAPDEPDPPDEAQYRSAAELRIDPEVLQVPPQRPGRVMQLDIRIDGHAQQVCLVSKAAMSVGLVQPVPLRAELRRPDDLPR